MNEHGRKPSFLERLKALDAMMTRGTWEADGYQITTLVGLIAETNHEPNAEGIALLRNCLPEIIALVELAKDHKCEMDYVFRQECEGRVCCEMVHALAALDAIAEEQQK